MNEPPVPPDLDLRDFQYMPLDVARLVDSDLNALASGDEFKAAVILWCKAWHQVPAASLPADERLLAHLAGFGKDMKSWNRVREVALRGFERCADGRLYHRVIAEKAIEAGEAKRKQRQRTVNATSARKQKHPQRDDARNVHQGKGREEKGSKDAELCSAGARDASAILEAQLREAAGWQNEISPKLAITGEIEALISAGAILETDILPVVRALAPKAGSRSTWKFFLAAIIQARDDRIAALTAVSPPSANGASHDQRTRKTGPSKSHIETTFEHLAGRDGEGDAPARRRPAG